MRVDPSTMSGVLDVVEQLSRRGSTLADATVPRFFNGAELDALATDAASIASDATRAGQLLGDAPVEALVRDRLTTVADAARAVSRTGANRPTLAALQSYGSTVHQTLDTTDVTVRSMVTASTDTMLTELLMAPPRDLGPAVLDELRSAVTLRSTLGLPPLSVGGRPIRAIDLAVDDPGAHVRLLQRAHLQQLGSPANAEQVAMRIDEIVGTNPGGISAVDAAELHVLVEAGVDATWTLPRAVGDTPVRDVLDQLSRGTDAVLLDRFAHAVTEHRATIRSAVPAAVAATDPPVGIRTLIDRDPSTWTAGDWRTLGTILQNDAASGSPLRVPRAIDGARSVERIIRDGIRGRAGAAEAMHPYVQAWSTIVPRADAAASMPIDAAAQRLLDEASTLLGRDVPDLDAADLARFRTLLDADPDGTILRGPRALRNTSSLMDAIASDAGHRATADRVRYLEAWRTTIGPGAVGDDARRMQVHELLLRTPETLTPDDWRRLATLVDGAPAGLLDELRAGPRAPDLGSIAWRHATTPRAIDGTTRLAFASATMAIDELTVDPVRLHGAMRDLVDRAPEELTSNDWARFRALLQADPEGAILDGPRRLRAAPDAGAIATSMMQGRTDMVLPARRLLAAWSAHMSGRWSRPEALVDDARRFAAREPSTLSAAEWRELSTLVDVAPAHLRAPRNIVGVDALEVTAARAAAGLPIAMPQADRSFRVWRIQFEEQMAEPGAMMAEVRRLVDRDPTTLSVGELRRLQSLVDFDAGWNTLGFPRVPDGTPVLGRLLDQALAGQPIKQTEWNRVVEAWRLHADGVATDQPRLEAAFYDALSPATGVLDDAAATQVRAILDADAGGNLLGSGRGGDLVDALRRELARPHGAALNVDSPLVDRLRNRLLAPGEVTERRAAIRAAIDGGSFPRNMTLDEVRDADPHWGERTHFEQLALEGRLSSFSGGNAFTQARDFLHRARDASEVPSRLPAQMRPLWDETRQLVDVNLERLAGRTPRGQVRGYSTHPDYAQVGRIQSNLELMHRAVAAQLPATQPGQQVRRIGERTATESLSW